MAKNHDVNKPSKRGRGRPEVDTEPVTVRMPREMLEAIDTARRASETLPSRADIARTALVEWLKARGYLK
jgi:Arc/MetJ-type ribon-helix-helix transcriptional regulator